MIKSSYNNDLEEGIPLCYTLEIININTIICRCEFNGDRIERRKLSEVLSTNSATASTVITFVNMYDDLSNTFAHLHK
jgi:hypothetical protein